MRLGGQYRICEALVERIGRTAVRVRLLESERSPQCGGCTACAAQGRRSPTLVVPITSPPPALRTRVRVRHIQINAALAATLLFGVPVALMITGMMLAGRPGGQACDAAATGTGATIGLAAGILMAWLCERALRWAFPPQLIP